MTIKVVLICEKPEENKRAIWGAMYDTTNTPGVVCVQWGRIKHGRDKNVQSLLEAAAQSLRQDVADDDAALKFIDKKVKEKTAKGYQMVIYEHDGLPITFLCDRQMDDYGRVRMQTWDGKN